MEEVLVVTVAPTAAGVVAKMEGVDATVVEVETVAPKAKMDRVQH